MDTTRDDLLTTIRTLPAAVLTLETGTDNPAEHERFRSELLAFALSHPRPFRSLDHALACFTLGLF